MPKGTSKGEAKRVVRTDEEILADLEAKLAAKRARIEARKNKGRDEAAAKRAKVRDRLVELNTKHNDLTDLIGDKAYANVTIEAGEEPAEVEDSDTQAPVV